MTTCTELDRRLVDNGHPFTAKELIEFTQGLENLLIQEGFNVRLTTAYPSRVSQNIYVRLVPSNLYTDIRIVITASAGVSSNARGGWIDVYCCPSIPRIVAGVMGDSTPIRGLLASMHRVRQRIEVVAACSSCHYYYSNPGHTGYCGMGRPLQKDCIDYTKSATHTQS